MNNEFAVLRLNSESSSGGVNCLMKYPIVCC